MNRKKPQIHTKNRTQNRRTMKKQTISTVCSVIVLYTLFAKFYPVQPRKIRHACSKSGTYLVCGPADVVVYFIDIPFRFQ